MRSHWVEFQCPVWDDLMENPRDFAKLRGNRPFQQLLRPKG